MVICSNKVTKMYLAIAWLTAWLVIMLFYIDPPAEPETVDTEPIVRTTTTTVTDSLLQIQEQGQEGLLGPKKPNLKKYRYTTKRGLIHEPIIVASCCTFSTYILQSGMETLVTPFTDYYLGWTMRENAIMYMAVGSVAFLGYIRFVKQVFDKVYFSKNFKV